MQTALCLTATRGMGASEVQNCYERAESLCHSLNRPLLLYSALMGQWRYSLFIESLSAAVQVAKRVHSLAQQGHNDSALMMGYQAFIRHVLLFGRLRGLARICDAWRPALALGNRPV
jgi:hypothetical protein